MKYKNLLLLLFIAVSLCSWAQERRNFSVGLGAEIGGGAVLIIPEVSGYIKVPLQFGDGITLTPKVGFAYLFAVMEDSHSNVFIPFGIDLIFTRHLFGFSVKYFLSVTDIANEGIFSTTLTGIVHLVKKAQTDFLLQFELGPAILFKAGKELKIFPIVHPGLGFHYVFRQKNG